MPPCDARIELCEYMKLIIVGAGKVAYYLIRELTREHEIVIIEQDENAACKIANDLSVVVIHGDGTSAAVLEPYCHGADMLIALTGKDENNLIACQVAKRHFHIPTTLCRVNNPRNLGVMERFGVDRSFSGTKVLAQMIEQEIDYQGLRIVHQIDHSEWVLVEFNLSPKSKACNKILAEYKFTAGSRIVVISDEAGKIMIPDGDTLMRAGDLFTMVCENKNVANLWKEMVHL